VKHIICLVVLALLGATNAYAVDVEIASIKLMYDDNKTTRGKTVRRELKRFDHDTYWSKPRRVDIIIEVLNRGNTKKVSVRLMPELYFLVQAVARSSYPSIKTNLLGLKEKAKELKSVTRQPVWIWNRVLESRPPVKIPPNEKMTVVFKGIDISNPYYATDYNFLAFNVRVFAELLRVKDSDYTNNVADYEVRYGD